MVIDYVLQRAPAAEEEAIVATLPAALDALSTFLGEGSEKAMHRLHSRTPGENGNGSNGQDRKGANDNRGGTDAVGPDA